MGAYSSVLDCQGCVDATTATPSASEQPVVLIWAYHTRPASAATTGHYLYLCLSRESHTVLLQLATAVVYFQVVELDRCVGNSGINCVDFFPPLSLALQYIQSAAVQWRLTSNSNITTKDRRLDAVTTKPALWENHLKMK